ncbi:8014_t:CDS:2, partial [Rhizophagus irregularis]
VAIPESEFKLQSLKPIVLSGIRDVNLIETSDCVFKVGRTTGLTKGQRSRENSIPIYTILAVYGGEIIALGHGALHVNNLNSVYGIGSPINAVWIKFILRSVPYTVNASIEALQNGVMQLPEDDQQSLTNRENMQIFIESSISFVESIQDYHMTHNT